jgi:acetyl-CoA acetyltransferase
LLSRGHPFGATGLAQIAELTWQLRGSVGRRQVPGARVGLAHTMGGTLFELEANACAVHILST